MESIGRYVNKCLLLHYEYLWMVCLDPKGRQYAINTHLAYKQKRKNGQCLDFYGHTTVCVYSLQFFLYVDKLGSLHRYHYHRNIFCRHVAYGKKKSGKLDFMDCRRFNIYSVVFL